MHWACGLAHALGTSELTAMVQVLVKNVHCAVVLADILRRCSASGTLRAIEDGHSVAGAIQQSPLR